MTTRRASKREPSDEAKRLRQEIFSDPLLDATSAAHVLGVDTSTILRRIRNDEIAAIKLGREYQIPQSELRAYIERAREEERRRIRIARVQRTVQEKVEKFRSTPALARRWGVTVCPNCMIDVLVRREGEADTGMQWVGPCDACSQKLTLASDEVMSFDDAEKERVQKIEQENYEKYRYYLSDTVHGLKLGDCNAYVKCPNCIHAVIFELENPWDPDTSDWVGTCKVCFQSHRYPRRIIPSITEWERAGAQEEQGDTTSSGAVWDSFSEDDDIPDNIPW